MPSAFSSAHSLSDTVFIFFSHTTHSSSTSVGVRSPDILERKVARDGQTTTAILNALRTSMLCRSLRTAAYASRTAFCSVSYAVNDASRAHIGVLTEVMNHRVHEVQEPEQSHKAPRRVLVRPTLLVNALYASSAPSTHTGSRCVPVPRLFRVQYVLRLKLCHIATSRVTDSKGPPIIPVSIISFVRFVTCSSFVVTSLVAKDSA